MSIEFVTGMSAFVSAVIIFIGSAFLLLMLVMGARLAYWVTASVTLAFLLIMGVVWSINPLGPVGEMPSWNTVAVAEDANELDFEAAAQYPEDPWRAANEEDAAETAQVAELESAATEAFAEALDKGDLPFAATDSVVAAEDGTVLLDQGGTKYGMTKLEVTNVLTEPVGVAHVVMKYDPGDPLGQARMITAGTFLLFVLHLFGLSRAERKTKRDRPEGLI